MPGPDSCWRALSLRILAPLLVFAFTLGAVEIILRTTHWFGARLSWATPDPAIGWRFLPDTEFWYDSRENDHPITGRTNSRGWVDSERTPARAAGGLRIAALGDSYVEALQVESSARFTALAEQLLDGGGAQRHEVMNFGRSGFTQSEEWLVLERDVLQFAPDAVVLFYYPPNDIADLSPELASDRMRPFPSAVNDDGVALDFGFTATRTYRLTSAISALKNHSALVSLVIERVKLLQMGFAKARMAKAHATTDRPPGIGGYLSLATSTPDPRYRAAYETSKALVAAMIRICAQRHVEFVLVAIDTPDYVPAVEERLRAADPSFQFAYFDRDLAAFAARHGARFLGLTAPFREHFAGNGEQLHFARHPATDGGIAGNLGPPGHWNYAGHRRVAELLAEVLRDIPAAATTPGRSAGHAAE